MPNISARLLKIAVATVLLISFSHLALAQNKLATCMSMASQMNTSLPAKIDFLTTLQATSCIEDKGRYQTHPLRDSSFLIFQGFNLLNWKSFFCFLIHWASLTVSLESLITLFSDKSLNIISYLIVQL